MGPVGCAGCYVRVRWIASPAGVLNRANPPKLSQNPQDPLPAKVSTGRGPVPDRRTRRTVCRSETYSVRPRWSTVAPCDVGGLTVNWQAQQRSIKAVYSSCYEPASDLRKTYQRCVKSCGLAHTVLHACDPFFSCQ